MKLKSEKRLKEVVCISLIFVCGPLWAQSYATRVVAYETGTGFATEFGSSQGFTNTLSVLGEPSRVTSEQFGGPIDPFSPPFLQEQLLSLGEGGFITLEFDTPIFNSPGNLHGIDFIIFGNSGFNITNGNFSGGGITDGSLFGSDPAETFVSVSEDNKTYFRLDPILAPKVDGYFPTDGSGDFSVSVDPSLAAADFAGVDLQGIRALYAGSGGGTGYDLSWATEAGELSAAKYVRIEVQSGKVEIDGISVVSPSAPGSATLVQEDFSSDPQSDSWQVFGEPSLFSWDQAEEHLDVSWDSSKPNSYFHKALGTTFSTSDDFTIKFDLHLDGIEIGVDPQKPFTFPLAIGLLNLEQATRSDYFRGTGINAQHGPRGVVEWNYLPDSGFGATVSSGFISLDNQWAFQNTFPLEIEVGPVYHIAMNFSAATGILSTTMTRDGEPFGPINDASLSNIFGNPLEQGFTELAVDTLAIASYSDAGQNPPEFAGSLLANGWFDNALVEQTARFEITGIQLEDAQVAIEFEALKGWSYWLERTSDLSFWETTGTTRPQSSGTTVLADEGPTLNHAFYRIRGGRP